MFEVAHEVTADTINIKI